MIRMTFEKYDQVMDRIDHMGYQCKNEGTYYPSVEDLKEKFKVKTKVDIEFLEWLLRTNEPPETDEEKASVKYMRKLLYRNLMLSDEPYRAESRRRRNSRKGDEENTESTESIDEWIEEDYEDMEEEDSEFELDDEYDDDEECD